MTTSSLWRPRLWNLWSRSGVKKPFLRFRIRPGARDRGRPGARRLGLGHSRPRVILILKVLGSRRVALYRRAAVKNVRLRIQNRPPFLPNKIEIPQFLLICDSSLCFFCFLFFKNKLIYILTLTQYSLGSIRYIYNFFLSNTSIISFIG